MDLGKIALFGGTGAIGNSIAAALSAERIGYRAVGRSRLTLEAEFGLDLFAEVKAWNPDDPASVREAARDVDTLIYLVGVPYDQFQLHPQLMKKTLEGAIAEGVKRIVLIGTVYPFGRPQTELVAESHPRDPHTVKGKMRKQQEDLLLEADARGKIRGTILRLPDFYGPHVKSSFMHNVFKAAIEGGRAELIAPIDTPHEYVFVPDVGPVVLALACEEDAYGRTWNFAGPGRITQRQFVEAIFREAGRPPKFRTAGKLTLRVLGFFNPLLSELVEMHYLLTTPVFMDDSALNGLIGPLHKTPYLEGIKRTLAEMK